MSSGELTNILVSTDVTRYLEFKQVAGSYVQQGASNKATVAKVPSELLAQLKPGGRLVAIEGDDPIMSAVRYTQGPEGVMRTPLVEINAKRLVGFPETPRFHF